MWGLLFSIILSGLCLAIVISLFLPRNKSQRLKLGGVLLLAPISYVVAGDLGSLIGDHLFYRDLPRLKQVIGLVQGGAIPIREGRIMLPSQYRDLASWVNAEHDSKGGLIVIFFVGNGFPVKHQCYVYISNDSQTAIEKDWPRGFRREKQWFEVSD